MSLKPNEVYIWTSKVLASLRSALEAQGFKEILPAILSERYEPGARHSMAVLGDRALPKHQIIDHGDGRTSVSVEGSHYYYLPVSHCIEKQLALEHAERVYCIAPCVRLLMEGESESARHLYTFFQAEVEWRTESVDEVLTTVETVLSDFASSLLARMDGTGLLDGEAADRIGSLIKAPYERIPFASARNRVASVGGAVNPHAAGDLTHAEERELAEAATAPFWLVAYPEGVRDSLYRRTADGNFATYDLVLPYGHGELATGGLRPDSATDIRRQASSFASDPHPFYAEWKDRTEIQTGGIGFGVERLIRYCSGASSVLDIRFAHDQGPNARIGA